MSFKSRFLLQQIQRTVGKNSGRFLSDSSQSGVNRIENVLIIGSGVMGTGIAQACAIPGRLKSITLQDSSQLQIDRARKNILSSLKRLKEKNMINIDSPEEVASRIKISLTTELNPKNHDNLLIIETITEVLSLKQKLFERLTTQFRGNESILYASNTSSFRIRDIAQYMDDSDKERFAGLHFFDAVLMKLAEIGRTPWTSDSTFASLLQFTADIDKVGISCVDVEGLIVNRLQIPMIIDAVKMVERGDAQVEDVDMAMKLGAGYPMGPFEEMDYIGLDTCRLILNKWTIPNGTSYESKLLTDLVNAGHLGRKSGKGFYDYTKNRDPKS